MVSLSNFKSWYLHGTGSNLNPAQKISEASDDRLIQSYLSVSQSILLDMLGLSELEPAKAVGLVKVTRTSGNAVIDIPSGTKFTTELGLVFVTSEDASITQSKDFIETGVIAEKTGSDGNVPDGTVFTSEIDNISVVAIGNFSQGVSPYDSLPNKDRIDQSVYLLCQFYLENRSTQEQQTEVNLDGQIVGRKMSYYRAQVYPALLRQITGMIVKYRQHAKFIPKEDRIVTT